MTKTSFVSILFSNADQNGYKIHLEYSIMGCLKICDFGQKSNPVFDIMILLVLQECGEYC